MPSLADMLYDLVAPQAAPQPNLPQEAGINDIGRGPGMNYLDPMGGAAPAQPPMPLDPRMLAYQNQQGGQMAQQAWNRAGPQAPPSQMAGPPQGPQDMSSWADALYKLVSPAMGGARAGPQPPARPAAPPQPGGAGALDAAMRFFLPNTYKGGTPQVGAPNPLTPPLWRDPRNPDDPLNRRR